MSVPVACATTRMGAAAPENAALDGLAAESPRAADGRLRARSAQDRRAAQDEYGAHGGHRQGDDAGRSGRGGCLLLLDSGQALGHTSPWRRRLCRRRGSRAACSCCLDGNETEPIGARLIEVPEHPDLTDLRDDRAGFVVYAPVGSLAWGEALVKTGGGRTTACADLSRRRSQGARPGPGPGGPIAELRGPAALGHEDERPPRHLVGSDERRRRESLD